MYLQKLNLFYVFMLQHHFSQVSIYMYFTNLFSYLQALEVIGESETVRSQDMPSTRPDLLQSDSSIEKDKGSSGSMEGGSQDLVMNTDVSLQDGCWISPPEHSYTSSSGCTTGLTQISSSENLETIDTFLDDGPGIEGPGANGPETRDGTTDSESDSSSNMQALLNNITLTHASNIHEIESSLVEEGRIESEDNSVAFKQIREQECDSSDPKSYSDSVTRVIRGKKKKRWLDGWCWMLLLFLLNYLLFDIN